MNLRKRASGGSESHSSALNDILFILLLFFLIVSTLANPNVVKVYTPKAHNNTKAKQTLVVTVDAKGQFYVGTKSTPKDSLQSAISQAMEKAADEEQTVVINGDSTAIYANVIAIMRATHALKLKTVLGVEKIK